MFKSNKLSSSTRTAGQKSRSDHQHKVKITIPEFKVKIAISKIVGENHNVPEFKVKTTIPEFVGKNHNTRRNLLVKIDTIPKFKVKITISEFKVKITIPEFVGKNRNTRICW